MLAEAAPLTVAVPGTCGELIQGWHSAWAEPVLVSCPIARYSYVTTRLMPGPHIEITGNYFKACRAARLLLDTLGRPDLGATITIHSQLLPGRGMASSTADVVGTLVGLGYALGVSLSATQIAQLACRVEPSDSTMFAGLAMLAYRGSGQAQALGCAPPLPLLMLDPGETVDTLAFNARLDLVAVRKLANDTATALALLRQGLASQDAAAIGAAATLSAVNYQAIHHNPLISQAQIWAETTGAFGLVRAHSGSLVGLLYPPGTDLTERAAWLSASFEGEIIETLLTGESYRVVDEVIEIA